MSETLLHAVLKDLGRPIRQRGKFCWRWPCPFCKSGWLYVIEDGRRFACDACHRQGGLQEYLLLKHPDANPAQLAAWAGEKPETFEGAES